MTGAVGKLDIKKWPPGWPTDRLSKSFWHDGFYCLRHPQRDPMKYLPDQKAWVPLEINFHDGHAGAMEECGLRKRANP